MSCWSYQWIAQAASLVVSPRNLNYACRRHLGQGCSPKSLVPFQKDKTVEWRMGMPASNHEVDVILLFGGDGTVHRHLGKLVQLRLPVLIVPEGSGNDFARALGLPNVRDSVSAWQRFLRRHNGASD